MVFSSVFGLIVWTHLLTFGATAECNLNSHTVFVVLGHSIKIGSNSTGVRNFALLVFAVSAIFSSIALILLLHARISGSKQLKSLFAYRDTLSPDAISCMNYCFVAFSLSVWVVELVTIEQTIARNGLAQKANQWTFGQTLSMIMVIGPVLPLLVTIRDELTDSRISDRNQERKRAKRAVEEYIGDLPPELLPNVSYYMDMAARLSRGD